MAMQSTTDQSTTELRLPAIQKRSIEAEADRRRFAREPMNGSCKIYHRAGGRFIAARPCDVSLGGALVTLNEAKPIAVGDRVELGVGEAIVRTAALVPGRVVRIERMLSGRQRVAIEFDRLVELKHADQHLPKAA